MTFGVTSITVSYEFSDKHYGSGETRFCSIKSEAQDPADAVPLDDIHKVVMSSLDMLHASAEAVHQARYASGELTGKELTSILQNLEGRMEKVKIAYKEAIT